MNKYYNTATERIRGVHYCVYCGAVAAHEHEQDYHHNIDDHYYHCGCQGAEGSLLMEEEIRLVKFKYLFVKPNQDVLKSLRFEADVQDLRAKHGIRGD